MEQESYPDLEKMCRLCLRVSDERELVDIFPQTANASAGANTTVQLSIPMRIMACASLEVQSGDGLPKSICSECRYQLEKSYYFRKRSQKSDSKLRKHIRLLSLGKKSRVFANTEDDDFEDELEFEDSIKFIQKEDENKQAAETVIWEQKLQREFNEKLSKIKKEWIEEYKIKLRADVAAELHSTVAGEVKEELRSEMEQELRTVLREECLEQAKVELRDDVVDECRELERLALLDDLQSFLNKRKGSSSAAKKETLLNSIEVDLPVKTVRVKRKEATVKEPETSNQEQVVIEQDAICGEIETDAGDEVNGEDEEEPEFYLIESINSHEDEGSISSEKSPRKRQKIEKSQAFEYFTNFRLTASDCNNQEPVTEESYHIADSGEVEYYKKVSNNAADEEVECAEVEGANEDENDEENGVIVLNLPEDMECQSVEPMNFTNLKKIYVMKSTKSAQSTSDEKEEQESKVEAQNKPEFTKQIVTNDKTTAVESNESSGYPVAVRKTDTPKTFKCDACPMEFSTANALNRHLRTHQKGEQLGVSYQCSICSVYLSCKSALNRHKLIHTGEKPHVCEECGRSFVQREVLKRHMLTHTGARPFKCAHCRRTFTQKNNLLNHTLRAHSEVSVGQRFSCHLCPKRFSHTSGLSRHLVTHTGLTFQCTECGRKFADRSSTKRHIANVHGKAATSESVKKMTDVEFYDADDTGEENGAEFLVCS